MVYGYVRVSTKDQNAARQISALVNEGVDEKNLFVDRKSGKDFQRKRYQSLLRKIKPGDVIFIKELDRLGRNYTEIIENWRLITVEKQTDIVVLDMPLLDTRKRGNDLTGRFGSANPFLCRRNGAQEHPSAAGGRNRRRKGERCSFWEPWHSVA